jgi:hypothetical protein
MSDSPASERYATTAALDAALVSKEPRVVIASGRMTVVATQTSGRFTPAQYTILSVAPQKAARKYRSEAWIAACVIATTGRPDACDAV